MQVNALLDHRQVKQYLSGKNKTASFVVKFGHRKKCAAWSTVKSAVGEESRKQNMYTEILLAAEE